MLKKDLLELCLLHLLTGGDRYGYELLRCLHDTFPETQESTVYALLRGLCREGSTTSYQTASPDGPERKYYRLTEQGRDKYLELLEKWRTLSRALRELGVV